MDSTKPLRLLDLPSRVHNVVFSQMEMEELYHLAKFSGKSRNAVRTFKPHRTYHFKVIVNKSSYRLGIAFHQRGNTFYHELRPMDNRETVGDPMLVTNSEDYWAATKEEIAFFLDVFTDRVNLLYLEDVTKVMETTEFLKKITPLPVECVHHNDYTIINEEIYKYVLKEFKDAKELDIKAYPSAGFRFDEMEPLSAENVCIDHARWVTVGHLTRCFLNVERVRLKINFKWCRIAPVLMHRFFNAWRNGSRMRELDIECDWSDTDLQAMFENVPTTEVKRVEVRQRKKVFYDKECFLIRQEKSGIEAVAYRGSTWNSAEPTFCFTTDFRLLRDDEEVEQSDVEEVYSDEYMENGDTSDEFEDEEEEYEGEEEEEEGGGEDDEQDSEEDD